MENILKIQMEVLENESPEMKNKLDGFNCRLETAEEKIC